MSFQFHEMSQPPALPPGEKAYEIIKSDGTSCHAACWVDRAAGAAPSMYGVTAAARAMNANGSPVLDDSLMHVVGEYTASIEKTVMVVGGVVDEERRQSVHRAALEGAIAAMLAELALVDLPMALARPEPV